MKRILLMSALFCLVISASASAQKQDLRDQGFKGKSWVTGNMGYAFGTGGPFTSFTEPISNTEFSTGAGVGFGGQYYYGIKKNLLIGGELMFQSYVVKVSAPANLSLGIPAIDLSARQTETNILINVLYGLSQSKNSSLFLMGGTGLYDFGGTQLGINSGLFWRKQVSDQVHLYGMPRLHLIMADSTPLIIQLTMGAQFSIGG